MRNQLTTSFAWLCLISALSFVSAPLLAHEDQVTPMEELVVYGRAEEQIGTATAASSGQVGGADIQLPSRLRVGELVEAVPGMVATQHSGTGKANQYFLRGFNLDHGTDFSVHSEGVPINMRTHGHGQGYLDMNFLIPEMVSTTKFRKGPYHAEVGDFSSAGSVDFLFYERLPEPVFAATFGEDNFRRGLAAGSVDVGEGVLTGAIDTTRYDGPWRRPEDLQQDKFQLRYATQMGRARALIDLQGYTGEWDSTDQVPLRAIQSGQIDELGFIDPDLGGNTDRLALNASFDFEQWKVSAYAVDYDFSLFSNFTYFLENDLAGDEFEQRDKRRVYGINIDGTQDLAWGSRPSAIRWGLHARADDIEELGLYPTASRIRLGAVREDSVEELSVGAYAELEMALTDRLRSVYGLRADFYDWQVDALQPENSGSGNDVIFSPKLGLAYRFSDTVEGYVNWGQGFHSNDVRGVTARIDPVSTEAISPAEALVSSEGGEIGIRLERDTAFNASLVAFWLELDSELVFVGDAGGTEANTGSERTGLEASLFWQAADWLAVDANYTFTDASFLNSTGGGREIPGAVESTASLGVSAQWPNGFTGSARVRYLGEAPLIEDGSVTTDASLVVNAGIGYAFQNIELRLDVFNLFDSNDADISYFYASRLPGEPADGIEDVHFHPLEPRTVRLSLAWRPQ